MTMNEQPWIEVKSDQECPLKCGKSNCEHWEGVAAAWRAAFDPARNPGLDRIDRRP